MDWLILISYSLFLLIIFLFSLGQLHLTWHYIKATKAAKKDMKTAPATLPMVTVQLPLYNEKYVSDRLIDAVCILDYPAEKLEIQVLDDSTDETVEQVAEKIDYWRGKGVNIQHLRRIGRQGFKAGALAFGLQQARGEFLAIFDADFIPRPDFIKKTIQGFDDDTGLVQTRWGHLNQNYSLLTKLQAFGLNAHFSVEQTGRSHAGSFINFNGTAGVWRRQCIEEAGGWSADTLTEDLDLSYRAQLKGWKFKYLEEYISPAELPVIMPAIKSQQYRWNKGAAETARKNLGNVFRSNMSMTGKIHALFHLLNSSVFVCLLFAAVLSVPALWIKTSNPELAPLFHLGIIFLIGFLSIVVFYWVAVRSTYVGEDSARYFFRIFPVFMLVSMGLSLHNGMAVIEGLLGIKTPFIRTPKFNILKKNDRWQENVYIFQKLTWTTIIEGILALYFLAAMIAGIVWNDYGLIVFHAMLAIGFSIVFIYSIKPVKYAGG